MNSEQIARVKINPNIRPFTKMDQLLVAKPTHLFKMTVFAGYHNGAKISARTTVVQTNGPTYGVMVRYFQNIERFLDSEDPNALEMPESTDVVDPNALTFVPARLLEALKDKRVQTRWDRRFLPFTQVADFPLNENERLLGLAMARLDPKYPIDALEVASSMLGNFTVVGSGHPQLS